jgi:adenylosuccinate lyase
VIPRYTTPEMAHIWSDGNRFEIWTRVELAACRAWEAKGRVPAGVTARLEAGAKSIPWEPFAARVLEIEETTRHDVIAYLSALEEQLGDDSRHVHFGMTSSDVVDTAFAALLTQAGEQVLARLEELLAAMRKKASEHKDTLCVGRTHGQAAEPTTFGLKLLTYVAELDRDRRRLAAALLEVAHGKLSGAVGNFGNIDPDIEASVMAELSLWPEPVSTQVVPRDRHATFFSVLAILGGAVERFAVELRHLMRSEVAEAFEPFGKGQRGSSAMPHKKNPILTENVTGIARLLRAYAMAALENQALWHERDISHSSVERVIGPDATTALDFGLARLTGVVEGMVVDESAMRGHLEPAGALVYSESVLLALVEEGVLRQEAYGWVQAAALEARAGQGTFQDRLKAHPDIQGRLAPARIDLLFDPAHHLRHVDLIFRRVFDDVGQPLPAWRPA